MKGTVVCDCNIKPMCTRMAFECQCSAGITVLLPDGKYTAPTKVETHTQLFYYFKIDQLYYHCLNKLEHWDIMLDWLGDIMGHMNIADDELLSLAIKIVFRPLSCGLTNHSVQMSSVHKKSNELLIHFLIIFQV